MSKKDLIIALFIIFFAFLIFDIYPRISTYPPILSYNLPFYIILISLGIFIIEAFIIRKELKGGVKKALFSSFLASLIIALIGLFISLYLGEIKIILPPFEGFLNINPFVDVLFSHSPLIIPFIYLFFTSVVIKAIVLFSFFHKEEARSKIIDTSFLMNLYSFSFLILLRAADKGFWLALFIAIGMIHYCFLKLFSFLDEEKNFSKRKRQILYFLIIIILIISITFIYWTAMEKKPSWRKDGRIISAIIATESKMDHVYTNDGNYDNFTKNHLDMIMIFKEVTNNGGDLIIGHAPLTNSTSLCMYSSLTSKKKYYWSKSTSWYCLDSTGKRGFCDGLENDPATTCRTDGISAYCPLSCD